jgi:hypothetical protein
MPSQKLPMTGQEAKPPQAQEFPTHSPDGVDLTLIRWMLSLSPLERLLVLQKSVASLEKLREGRLDD